MKLLVLIVFTATLIPICWSQTYVVGGYDYPPFIYDKARKGIYVDLMAELARVSHLTFKWEHYPYARLDALFTKARIHIEVGSSPLWTTTKKIPGVYTKPFYTLKDVVVYRSGDNQNKGLRADLTGRKIGLVRGYSFPQFQQKFDDGIAFRIDAANELALMKLLLNHRVDQIFIGEDVFLYHQKNNQEYIDLISGDVVGSYQVAIRVHPNHQTLVKSLNNSIQILHEEGVIKGLFRKHLY